MFHVTALKNVVTGFPANCSTVKQMESCMLCLLVVTHCKCVCVRDAWSRLGEMSSDTAMAAYVDEMKKVAQEVHHTSVQYIS